MKYKENFLNVIEYVKDEVPDSFYAGTLYVVDEEVYRNTVKKCNGSFAVYRDTTRTQGDYPEGVKYILEGEGAFDPGDYGMDYLEKVYRRLNKIPWVILETDRCLVRETCKDDLDSFYEIYSWEGMTDHIEPLMERSEEEKYTDNYRDLIYEIYGHGIWTVVLKESGEIIGRAGLDERAGSDIPELGFVIGKKWQGNGFAYEVCSAILKWAKAEGMTEVMSFSDKDNHPSISLLLKLGFTLQKEAEGTGGCRVFLSRLPGSLFRRL